MVSQATRCHRATLVTVTYNSSATLTEFWGSFDPSWAEWVVVDNGSCDDSVEVAKRLGARVIRLEANRGFSFANNSVRSEQTGDVIIFCNPDLRVTSAGIECLSELARRRAALVAPQLVNTDGSVQESGRGAPYPHRKIQHLLGRGASYASYSRIAEPGDQLEVVWAMGAAIAASRETLDRIGWWNDKYFIYYEDHEIALRALRHGVPTIIDGSTRWTHGWARETARGFSWRAWGHEIRSGLRFYLTHLYCILPLGRHGRRLRQADRLVETS
ncbi:glycosyltransferase family 2 protein [Streptomyces sp. NBC_01594]